MKKKNGFNIMLFVLSCIKNTKRTAHGILLQTDRNFSAMSAKEGMHKAFLFYIADSGVLLRNNSYPLKSRQSHS